MHGIFFLSDILFTSCYFTCTCLVLEISLFGSIVVNVFHNWHSYSYMDRLRPSQDYTYGAMVDKKQLSSTKSTMKVETGIVTLISYHHYLKIIGNNKLWPDMQKESWNIHGTKILICSRPIRWMGPIRNPNWSTSRMRVTLSYLMNKETMTDFIKCFWEVHNEYIGLFTCWHIGGYFINEFDKLSFKRYFAPEAVL